MSNVTCLVVNFSTPGDLTACVGTGISHEGSMPWVVYQNRHPDPELMRLNEKAIEYLVAKYPVKAIIGEDNRGHGFGINRAAELVETPFMFIVNPDCVWTEPILGQLLGVLETEPRAAVVGPKQMDSLNRITAGGIIGTMGAPKHRFWHTADSKNVMARDLIQCPTVAGSAMLVPTNVFRELGGLLEAKHYFSETWFCYHANVHGYSCWYYGVPWMRHEWHRSSPMGSPYSDGHIQHDREMFRRRCDEHQPPIPHD